MICIILGIGHNPIGISAGKLVHHVNAHIGQFTDDTGWHEQVTMIGGDGRFFVAPAIKCHTSCLKLRQVQQHCIRFTYQPSGHTHKLGHNAAFAQTEPDRHTHNLDPVYHFFSGQAFIKLGGHQGDLVAAYGKSLGEALSINCQPADMRTVVG
ncbi:hypothetical protein SDC9_154284 [bioreactor metagenome]|uniref:Uncharacterized protein n=1 Tax=bioreactor metagenome TaxID=1076179 RepID=A0A645EYA6_9ZZZZ